MLRPLSRFCLPGTEGPYNGLVLGYGAVDAGRMDRLVQQLGQVIEAALAG